MAPSFRIKTSSCYSLQSFVESCSLSTFLKSGEPSQTNPLESVTRSSGHFHIRCYICSCDNFITVWLHIAKLSVTLWLCNFRKLHRNILTSGYTCTINPTLSAQNNAWNVYRCGSEIDSPYNTVSPGGCIHLTFPSPNTHPHTCPNTSHIPLQTESSTDDRILFPDNTKLLSIIQTNPSDNIVNGTVMWLSCGHH